MDMFVLIAPYLDFKEVLMCTRVCKDWSQAARYLVIPKTINIVYLPGQLALLQRVRVSGLKVFDTSNARCLMDAYNHTFSHLQSLSIWTNKGIEPSPGDMSPHTVLASQMATVSFSSLRFLHIGEMVLNQKASNFFADALRRMPCMQEISFRFLVFVERNTDGVVWEALEGMLHLESLELTLIRGNFQFKRVPPTLKKLNIHRNELSTANTISLMSSLQHHPIQEVKFHGFWDNFDIEQNNYDAHVFESMNLSSMRYLHSLCFENVNMSPSDMNLLLRGRLPNTVTKLELACNFLGGGGLIRAFENDVHLPLSITWLDLGHNNITTTDVQWAVVPHCLAGIHTLILDGNHQMFGATYPRVVHTMVFCDVVSSYTKTTLKRIDCNNCGWDELDHATHQLKYPNLLKLTEDVAAWGGIYEKKCGSSTLTRGDSALGRHSII